ncbi:D-alanyl-D-alanine carboxypeptidase family protein [Microbaculum marinisediminis]|uniref:D-alanyl-D-alanine carboxypeptidase family protein n=1 Tax=Microbaculum marinisediminis TaxID=2931392 RepID=UPI0021BF746D|nr:D-alanyl-D-alanine carboxypeptidase family protein [Microbaculum sp. A6E488]
MVYSGHNRRRGGWCWRHVAAAVLFAASSLVLAPTAGRAGPALVFDTGTGEVLHAYGAYTPWHPASLTKIMTAYVTFEAIRDGTVTMKSPVRVSELALSQPPSKMGFPVGTEISIEYALRILMVKSANDIAVALAEAVGGNYDVFVAKMNSTARRLGMWDTRYVNSHGLHDERQVTTAHDLALLTRAMIRDYPQYQAFFEIQSIQVGQKVLRNHNKLIGRFRGADGMKTGYVCASGFNIVATATRGGRRLAAVVLGGVRSSLRDEVTAGLLEAGFEAGSGFSLFGKSGRPTIDSLPRPASIGAPVDMRPYVCQKKKAPAEYLSFGTEPAATVEANSSRSLNPAGTALALTAASAIDLGPMTPGAKPVIAFDVPLPRPRPVEAPKTNPFKLFAKPSNASAGSSDLTVRPRSNPMR